MNYFEENKNVRELLMHSVLSVPGVSSIPFNEDKNPAIYFHQDNFDLIVNLSVNCFSYVNIWSVLRQVQIKAIYILEKLNQHQKNVTVNVNVFDIVEENN